MHNRMVLLLALLMHAVAHQDFEDFLINPETLMDEAKALFF